LPGPAQAADLFCAPDREALASIEIDLDAVQVRIEAAFGPDALTWAGPGTCAEEAACGAEEPSALSRHPRRAGPDQHASPGGHTTGHIPFTPHAKKAWSTPYSRRRHGTTTTSASNTSRSPSSP
jgi:hypothetical protein